MLSLFLFPARGRSQGGAVPLQWTSVRVTHAARKRLSPGATRPAALPAEQLFTTVPPQDGRPATPLLPITGWFQACLGTAGPRSRLERSWNTW